MIDLSKLTDAIGKVAELAKSHASITAIVADAHAARDFAENALAKAQQDIDDLVDKLLDATHTTAEAVGISAVAAALVPVPAPAPVEAPVAPVATDVAPVAPAEVPPVAPVAPVAVGVADTMAQAAAAMAAKG